MMEQILGCKWSLRILGIVRRGTCRPGAMQRCVAGLTTKVMNERLAKMVRFGILQKKTFHTLPLRVEYRFTAYGRRFVRILDAIARLRPAAR